MSSRWSLVLGLLLAGCHGAGSGETESATEDTGGPLPSCDADGIVDGDVVLSSAEQVEALAGCTAIHGSLTLSSPGVADLAPLSSLSHVRDALVIEDTGLTSLAGFEGLRELGANVHVVRNQELTSLEALASVEDFGTTSAMDPDQIVPFVEIDGNTKLATLDGLEFVALSELSPSLWIGNNPVLTSLDALASLTTLDNLQLQGNAALSELAGLEGIVDIRLNFRLFETALSSLDALSQLEEVGSIFFVDNHQLVDASGLASLAAVNSFEVFRGDKFTGLGSLPALASLGGLVLLETDALEQLGSLADGATIGSVRLDRVDAAGFEVASLDALGTVAYLELRSVASLSSMVPSTTLVITDSLTILNCPDLPQADAEAWAALQDPGLDSKIAGNLGYVVPDSCAWVEDGECDEDLGICPPDSDLLDCQLGGEEG